MQGQQSTQNGADQGPPWPGQLPSLHLYPLNDSFVPKLIHLPPGGQHVSASRMITLFSSFSVCEGAQGKRDQKSTACCQQWSDSADSLCRLPRFWPLLLLLSRSVRTHLHRSSSQVKIGRQTNAKTVPGERNGYFDSKVLSRTHAEVWEEGNKVHTRLDSNPPSHLLLLACILLYLFFSSFFFAC